MLVHGQVSGKSLTNTYRVCMQTSEQLPSHSLELCRTQMLACACSWHATISSWWHLKERCHRFLHLLMVKKHQKQRSELVNRDSLILHSTAESSPHPQLLQWDRSIQIHQLHRGNMNFSCTDMCNHLTFLRKCCGKIWKTLKNGIIWVVFAFSSTVMCH